MTRTIEIREEQTNFLKHNPDPRPMNFFREFNYRKKSSGYHDYILRLESALQDDSTSEKLLNLKREYDNNDYNDDWEQYEDWKKNKKINDKIKKRKRETHGSFHARLDNGIDNGDDRKRNPDSSKKSASARRKTKKVKLSDSDEDLDDNKDSSESHENPTGRSETPPPRSPPKEKLLSTPNKRNMYDVEIVRYLDAMENCLKYNRVLNDAPPVWTKPLETYLDNAFKKEKDEFKMSIMQEIKEGEGNHFRLYCEKILMDFYNLVDIFPDMSRRIGERKYIVQNISSLFKYYETTFGKISFDWIEVHSPASKLTKSTTNSGIVKVDIRGVRLLDDKEVLNVEVSGPPSLPTKRHTTGDTKKSLHTDILNLISILLDYLDLSVEIATRIKVFSFQIIEYRITLYSLNMLNDGSFLASELGSALFPFSFDARAKYKQILFLMGIFHKEVMNQISLMQELDLKVDHYERKSVRSVLKIPMSLKELLQKKFDD